MSTKHVRTTGDLVRFRLKLTIECSGCGSTNILVGPELMRLGASTTTLLPFDDAIGAWKQIARLKGWKPLNPDLTPKRKAGLGKILSVHGLDGWVAALHRAADSDWLGGPDSPAWFHFSFVCSFENFTKLNEGNYDRAFSAAASARQGNGSSWLAAREQLSRAL